MNAIIEHTNSAGYAFVEFALPMLIQSGVLIVILLLADLLLRKKVRAAFRYWMWILVLLKLVLPTSLSSPVSLGRWLGEEMAYMNISKRIAEPYTGAEVMPPVPAASTLTTNPASAEIDIHTTAASPRLPVTSADKVVPEVETAPMAPPPIPVTPPSWQGILFLLWLSVVITMGLLLLKRAAFVRGLVAQAKDADNSTTKLLEDCCKNMRVVRKVGLKVSDNTTSPAVCGLFRPVILVPENLAPSLSSNQLHMVLLHELAHIKRGDLWVSLAQTILQILYFYNPLLWLANAIIRRTREQAVDQTVLVAMGKNAGQYPQALVDIAKLAFKRPALSLRLIGVVESRDALYERIKRILSHPIPKTAKLGILGLLIIVIGAAILLPMSKAMQPEPSVVNNGPLDIRLLGVCPDCGDQLYDAGGRKLETTYEPLGVDGSQWKDESQRRDFIFKVPDVNDQLLFLTFPRIRPAGTNHMLGGGFRSCYDPAANPSTLIYSITFDRNYQRQFFYIRFKDEIRYIDFTLRYLFGARGQATCTFTGPFTAGQTIKADLNRPYSLTPMQSKGFPQYSGIDLLFATGEPFDSDALVVAYDLQGRRYLLDMNSGRSGSRGANLTYRDIPLPLNEIAVVTFGEKPHEITFRNVAVYYPDRPYRTYPEFLDEMAQRLSLTGMLPKGLAQYQFKSPAEAIDVIDIVRGDWLVRQAFEAIRYSKPKIDISTLDQATQNKIQKAATAWAENDYLAKYGISLGLMGRWPEFFDMAIERLGRKIPYNNGSLYDERTRRQDNANISNVMVNYRMDRLTAEQVQKIKELILKTDEGSILHDLFWYLKWTKSQATTDVLWELAQNENPWIWVQATEEWYSRTSRTRLEYDGLPVKMKLRLILTNDNIRDDNLEEKALSMLPEIFTPELGQMSSQIWRELWQRISRDMDRKVATEIFVNYLRRLQSEMTARQWIGKGNAKWQAVHLIRALNVWYGTNIGNLGTDETRGSINQQPRSFFEFQNLIAQAIQWYDGNRDATPIELPFAGKVVDTAGKPIAGAELSFTKREDYKDERGDWRQREAHAGLCLTDATGYFEFGDFTNDSFYTLDVTAGGFLAKEELHIQRLIDGRYRYHEDTAPEDNVIVLQRPGKISGIVLGADGKPLADAELRLFAVNRYSQADPTKIITTNSEGEFTAGDISKGHFLLSYADLRTVPYARGFRQEYDGRCGAVRLEAEEAGYLTDVVLDLSKSICSLELQVVDDTNKPVQDIYFTFYAEMEGGSYKYASIFHVHNALSHNGVYRFEGMPPGIWRLYISDDSSRFDLKKIDVKLSREKTAYYKVICE